MISEALPLVLSLVQICMVLLLGCMVAFLAHRYYQWQTTPLRQIPGPPVGSFWIGYAYQLFWGPFMKSHKQWWADLRVKHDGDVPLLAISMELGRFSVQILDPDLVKEVLTCQVNRFPIRFPKHVSFVRIFLGDGLITLEGPQWHRHRRIIQPSFYTRGLEETLDYAVPKHTSRFIKAWKSAQKGRVIDVSSHLSALSIDILGDVAFAHDFNAIKTVEEWAAAANPSEEKVHEADDPLIKSLHDVTQPTISLLIFFILGFPSQAKYLDPRLYQACRLIDKAAENVVQAARQSKNAVAHQDDSNPSGSPTSLLHTLFDAQDTNAAAGTRKTLNDNELRDEVKTFIVAGHETMSTLCYWALYALAKYPDIQQRVYDDIAKNMLPATSGAEENPIHLDEISKMDYLDAFISEVLRLYPPVGLLMRYTSQQEQFGKYTIPAGTKIMIPIHLIHRHPDHWKKPLEFMPERWLNKDEVNARHRYAYLPFGGGGRTCIGQKFALMEVKLMMANIIAAFHVELAPSLQNLEEMEFKSMATLKGLPEVKICIRHRLIPSGK